ncbi:MAG: outer membrane lipoprotein-sorting protein [Vicinamibacteraceae bacterium]
MNLSAFLVIFFLAIPLLLASFGIPPSFLLPVVLGASAPVGTAEFRTAATPGRGLQAAAPAPGSADWIARRIDERDTGRDSRLTMRMRLFDRQGRARERTLSVNGLRGQGSTGDRVLIRFTYPNDIAGTGFLVWERPGGDDDRFLYLPALSRVRRITGAERQESFVGSDFTYEDIGGRAIEDYTYTLVAEDGPWNGSWADASGARHPAWRLESRAKDADAAYPKVVSTIRKDNFVVVAADVFNRRGERAKSYRVTKLSQVQGIWTVMASTMTNEVDRTRTELGVTEARYDTGLAERDFSRRELENGAGSQR